MVKILYALNGVFHKGGTETVVLNYYNNINPQMFHIDFLVHGHERDCVDNTIHQYLRSKGSKIFYVTPRGENYFLNIHEIKEILLNNDYDIVHSHMDAAGMFVLRIAKKKGIEVRISHSHNTASSYLGSLTFIQKIHRYILEYARKELCKYANVRIACSKEAGEWLFGDNDFILINNAINVEKYMFNENVRSLYRKKLKLDSKYVVGHVGRFADQKNHTYLMDVFYEIKQKIPSSVLLLVGSGEHENMIRTKVQNLGLSDQVIFLGNRNDVSNLMQAMDIFLLPSLHEGLPMVGVEAQAAGLPCIVSDSVSHELNLTDNIYFKSINESPKLWAEQVEKIMSQDITRSIGAKQVVEAGFDISSIVKTLENIYIKSINTFTGSKYESF